VLWFIHRLEQLALLQGGRVHFIIGNHELKAMHGNVESASPKYLRIASMLNRQQYDLTGPNAYIGRWLESKNALEVINGVTGKLISPDPGQTITESSCLAGQAPAGTGGTSGKTRLTNK